MCYSAPDVLDALLSHLADQMATYIKYQIDSGGCLCCVGFLGGGGEGVERECAQLSYMHQVVTHQVVRGSAGQSLWSACAQLTPRPNSFATPKPPAAGAQCIQIFDSWGGQLPPREWDRWSGPYLKRIVQSVKATHPHVPLTLYANGSGGLLERLKATGVDVVGCGSVSSDCWCVGR